ncbi:hypothetical protein [uncultured Actinomyces sp.]|uniref:hypothetical protein n=1 Tax=uncultured Actinomyces sp. TaxID=249061 RepID=UPI002634D446|nr:hypothetical protein [uncultured Actinomyces sp.]
MRATDQLWGKSTTMAGPLLRDSIKIRKAGWRGSWPSLGSSKPVTVAHCGPTLKGEVHPDREYD